MVAIEKGDIVQDDGSRIYILNVKMDRRISRKDFKELVKNKTIYFDRHQWGTDYYLVTGEDGDTRSYCQKVLNI